MASYLKERGLAFTTPAEIETLSELKEKHASVALDFEQSLYNSYQSPQPSEHAVLPGDTQIEIQHATKFLVGESIFTPSLAGSQLLGLSDLIFDSLAACPSDTFKNLAANIVLNGSTANLSGLQDRIEADLKQKLPSHVRVKTIKPHNAYTLYFLSLWFAVN